MIVGGLVAAAVHVPGRAAAARRLRRGRAPGHRRHGQPARHELPAAAERVRGALPGARAAAGRVQPAVAGLPVAVRGGHARPGGRGLPAGAAGDRIAVRAVAAGDARQRHRGRLAGQEPAVAARRDARARRRAGRAERRDPGRVHQPVGAVGVGLRGDHRAVRGRDHRRRGQPSRGRARRHPGAGRLRGGHQVHSPVRAAWPGRRPAMGGDRAADRGLPLVPAAGDAARAPPQDQVPAGRRPRHTERGCGDPGRRLAGARAGGRGAPGRIRSPRRRAPGSRSVPALGPAGRGRRCSARWT